MGINAEYKLMTLQLLDINADPDLQSRESLNQDTISEYASEFAKDGVLPPPVTVYHDSKMYWLADGFHRLAAFKSIGRNEINAKVYEGTKRDALLFSVGANNDHGLRRTAADKRNAVKRLLNDPEWGAWSNMEIARQCNVSHTLVNELRRSLEAASSEKTFLSKHGTVAKMNTQDIGKSKRQKRKEQDLEDAQHAMTSNEEMEMRLRELSDTLNDVLDENVMLKDKIAIGQWDASEIEKIDIQDTVKELRQRIVALESENFNLRDSRDMFQNRNAELIRQVKAMQAKLKRFESSGREDLHAA